ncbi:MAG: DNA replication/repair protein RecF [Varibaculum sp.]|nr:DNA replication/repair protein RecF [Varibaculum sp.]
MFITDIQLTDFRSYGAALVHLPRGTVVLRGGNGQGKTNFIEAIGYLATLHSHRVSADQALIRAGGGERRAAVINARVDDAGRELRLDIEIVASRANRARLNRQQVRPRDLIGQLKVVLFAPEDLAIVSGDPAARRHFLDDLVVQTRPVMAGIYADYNRVLKQRGALLKQMAAERAGRSRRPPDEYAESTLAVWDGQLLELTERIITERRGLLDELQPHATAQYRAITEDTAKVTELSLEYRARHLEYASSLAEAITAARSDELRRGVNLVGAHRDDMDITLGGLPVKGYASHGETWSTALALRLATFELFRSHSTMPILLLDDVFAELDESRRRALIPAIKAADQAIITVANGTEIPVELDATVLEVSMGSGRTELSDPGVGSIEDSR